MQNDMTKNNNQNLNAYLLCVLCYLSFVLLCATSDDDFIFLMFSYVYVNVKFK
jgi:hypothetical protein